MTYSTVSSKGQIVIPAEIRRKLGIKPKMKVVVKPLLTAKKALIEPLPEDPIEAGYGFLEKYLKGKTAEKIMKEVREEERKLERLKAKKLGLG